MDEEDGRVQFTHQTVKEFFLNSFPDQNYADFHFQHSEIDHYAGEICVTYLNFNDLKRKLIKLPKALTLPTPEAILKASLSSRLNSKTEFIWEKLARGSQRFKGQNKHSGHLFAADALRKCLEESSELPKEHPFLLYASEYWLQHSACFEKLKLKPGICGKDCYYLRWTGPIALG